jgi:hypothetical protein
MMRRRPLATAAERQTAVAEDERLAILRGRIQQAQYAVQQHTRLLNESLAELNRLATELRGYLKGASA